MKTSAIYVGGSMILFVLSTFFTLSLFFPQFAFSQGAGVGITGYAWSENVGWIDLNCSNSGICGSNPFGLFVDTNGIITGYAWSENIGWVSANSADLAGCPVAPCTANLSPAAMTGWLRVIEGGTAQSGGWDGFISLNGSGYGVVFNNGNFSSCSPDLRNDRWGCAWGDVNVGLVDFSNAHTTYNTCAASSVFTCSGTQTIVRTDTNTSCQQTVTNTSCTAPQFCSAGSSVCLWPPVTPVTGSGGLTGRLQVRPNLIPKNSSTTVAWNFTNVTNCTVTGTNGDSWSQTPATQVFSSAGVSCTHDANGSCRSGNIAIQTLFTLSCTALDSTSYSERQTVNIIPGFEETCAPGDTHVDGKCVRP